MTADRRRVWSGRAARLGIFAILFQAILFGWHHHELAFAGKFPAPVVQNSIAPLQSAVDSEDGCEICQVLHHQTATAADFAFAARPQPASRALAADDVAFVVCAPSLGFHARAPPLV